MKSTEAANKHSLGTNIVRSLSSSIANGGRMTSTRQRPLGTLLSLTPDTASQNHVFGLNGHSSRMNS